MIVNVQESVGGIVVKSMGFGMITAAFHLAIDMLGRLITSQPSPRLYYLRFTLCQPLSFATIFWRLLDEQKSNRAANMSNISRETSNDSPCNQIWKLQNKPYIRSRGYDIHDCLNKNALELTALLDFTVGSASGERS